MSYRSSRYQLNGYRSQPVSNRSSMYSLPGTDYSTSSSISSNTNAISDFDRQFKRLMERTEIFTNRVEKLQTTATSLKRGFQDIDRTVSGRAMRDTAFTSTYDRLIDLDPESTEEQWKKYLDMGMLIEKAVGLLRQQNRFPKPIFEYSPESRSPYSYNVTPGTKLVSNPRTPVDRYGRKIIDKGCEIILKHPTNTKIFESSSLIDSNSKESRPWRKKIKDKLSTLNETDDEKRYTRVYAYRTEREKIDQDGGNSRSRSNSSYTSKLLSDRDKTNDNISSRNSICSRKSDKETPVKENVPKHSKLSVYDSIKKSVTSSKDKHLDAKSQPVSTSAIKETDDQNEEPKKKETTVKRRFRSSKESSKARPPTFYRDYNEDETTSGIETAQSTDTKNKNETWTNSPPPNIKKEKVEPTTSKKSSKKSSEKTSKRNSFIVDDSSFYRSGLRNSSKSSNRSSFHEYIPGNRIPLKERLRLKQQQQQQSKNENNNLQENTKTTTASTTRTQQTTEPKQSNVKVSTMIREKYHGINSDSFNSEESPELSPTNTSKSFKHRLLRRFKGSSVEKECKHSDEGERTDSPTPTTNDEKPHKNDINIPTSFQRGYLNPTFVDQHLSTSEENFQQEEPSINMESEAPSPPQTPDTSREYLYDTSRAITIDQLVEELPVVKRREKPRKSSKYCTTDDTNINVKNLNRQSVLIYEEEIVPIKSKKEKKIIEFRSPKRSKEEVEEEFITSTPKPVSTIPDDIFNVLIDPEVSDEITQCSIAKKKDVFIQESVLYDFYRTMSPTRLAIDSIQPGESQINQILHQSDNKNIKEIIPSQQPHASNIIKKNVIEMYLPDQNAKQSGEDIKGEDISENDKTLSCESINILSQSTSTETLTDIIETENLDNNQDGTKKQSETITIGDEANTDEKPNMKCGNSFTQNNKMLIKEKSTENKEMKQKDERKTVLLEDPNKWNERSSKETPNKNKVINQEDEHDTVIQKDPNKKNERNSRDNTSTGNKKTENYEENKPQKPNRKKYNRVIIIRKKLSATVAGSPQVPRRTPFVRSKSFAEENVSEMVRVKKRTYSHEANQDEDENDRKGFDKDSQKTPRDKKEQQNNPSAKKDQKNNDKQSNIQQNNSISENTLLTNGAIADFIVDTDAMKIVAKHSNSTVDELFGETSPILNSKIGSQQSNVSTTTEVPTTSIQKLLITSTKEQCEIPTSNKQTSSETIQQSPSTSLPKNIILPATTLQSTTIPQSPPSPTKIPNLTTIQLLKVKPTAQEALNEIVQVLSNLDDTDLKDSKSHSVEDTTTTDSNSSTTLNGSTGKSKKRQSYLQRRQQHIGLLHESPFGLAIYDNNIEDDEKIREIIASEITHFNDMETSTSVQESSRKASGNVLTKEEAVSKPILIKENIQHVDIETYVVVENVARGDQDVLHSNDNIQYQNESTGDTEESRETSPTQRGESFQSFKSSVSDHSRRSNIMSSDDDNESDKKSRSAILKKQMSIKEYREKKLRGSFSFSDEERSRVSSPTVMSDSDLTYSLNPADNIGNNSNSRKISITMKSIATTTQNHPTKDIVTTYTSKTDSSLSESCISASQKTSFVNMKKWKSGDEIPSDRRKQFAQKQNFRSVEN